LLASIIVTGVVCTFYTTLVSDELSQFANLAMDVFPNVYEKLNVSCQRAQLYCFHMM